MKWQISCFCCFWQEYPDKTYVDDGGKTWWRLCMTCPKKYWIFHPKGNCETVKKGPINPMHTEGMYGPSWGWFIFLFFLLRVCFWYDICCVCCFNSECVDQVNLNLQPMFSLEDKPLGKARHWFCQEIRTELREATSAVMNDDWWLSWFVFWIRSKQLQYEISK